MYAFFINITAFTFVFSSCVISNLRQMNAQPVLDEHQDVSSFSVEYKSEDSKALHTAEEQSLKLHVTEIGPQHSTKTHVPKGFTDMTTDVNLMAKPYADLEYSPCESTEDKTDDEAEEGHGELLKRVTKEDNSQNKELDFSSRSKEYGEAEREYDEVPYKVTKEDILDNEKSDFLSEKNKKQEREARENMKCDEYVATEKYRCVLLQVPTSKNTTETAITENWQPQESPDLRYKLSIATKRVANFFHIRFKSNFKNIYEKTKEIDYIINPCEIVTLLSLLMFGMENTSQRTPTYSFTEAPSVKMTPDALIKAVTEYMYGEQYDKPVDSTRKSLLAIGLFQRRSFPIHQTFRNYAESRFQATFFDVTDEERKSGRNGVKQIMRDYVNEKTEGNIPEMEQLLRVNFDLRIVATTFIRGNWSVEFEEEKDYRTFTCIGNHYDRDSSRKYLMRTNTEELITEYYDFGNRFAVYLPINNANQGILMYVPKKLELFRKMDKKMDFRDWYNVLNKMKQRSVKIIFPTFSADIERDIEPDWAYKEGRPNIFMTDGINYEGMTTLDFLYAANFVQRNTLSLDNSGMKYASLTFLTLRRDQERFNSYGTSYTYFKKHPTSDSIKTVIGREPTTSNYRLTGGQNIGREPTTSNYRLTGVKNISSDDVMPTDNIIIHSTLKLIFLPNGTLNKDMKSENYFRSSSDRRERYISIKGFRRSAEARKCKSGSEEIKRNCRKPLRLAEKCRHKAIVEELSRLLKNIKPVRTTPPSNGGLEEQVTVLVNTSFFYAVINRDNGIFYSVGRVYHCP